jgi:NADPH:quinone reductase-like Zn-dependent oxidoreductase
MTDQQLSRAQQSPAGTAGVTMTGIAQDRYGPAPEDVLRVARIPVPAVADGHVLVRVHAASVDRGTWHLMAGLPYPVRLAGFGLRRPKYANPGRALAGTVEAVGAGVRGVSPGDPVYGIGAASFAEYALAPVGKVAAKPASLSFAQAAAVPISGLTALQAVRDHGRIHTGEQVLIIGASGGVDSFAVQLARSAGAEVTGVCSTGKVDEVRGLGADHVIDYTREEVTDGRRRYDVILDIGGNRRLSRLRRILTPRGRLVIVGGENGGRWLGGTDRQIRARLLSLFVRQQLGTFLNKENARDLHTLREMMERSSLPSTGATRWTTSPRPSGT